MCERVIIINKGEIIADAKTDEITKTIEDGYRYEVKICGPQKDVLPAIKKLSGVVSVESTGARDMDSMTYVIDTASGADVRKAVFALCATNSWPMIALYPVGTDLESVFIKLVDTSDGKIGVKTKSKRSR